MRSLLITGRWNVSLPSGVLPWNSIFGPGRRSKYNNIILTRKVKLTECVPIFLVSKMPRHWVRSIDRRRKQSAWYRVFIGSLKWILFRSLQSDSSNLKKSQLKKITYPIAIQMISLINITKTILILVDPKIFDVLY